MKKKITTKNTFFIIDSYTDKDDNDCKEMERVSGGSLVF